MLRGSCKRSHISQYAALPKSPSALAGGLVLFFQQPVREKRKRSTGGMIRRDLPA
jgi:hypothetical protein